MVLTQRQPGTKKKNDVEILSRIKSLKWGEKHAVMLDMKGRVFTMGDSDKCKLGIIGNLPEIQSQPRLVSYGLPLPEETKTKIVEMFTGNNHSLAVGKNGDLYSWGQGAYGRLGLGYLKDNSEIPN